MKDCECARAATNRYPSMATIHSVAVYVRHSNITNLFRRNGPQKVLEQCFQQHLEGVYTRATYTPRHLEQAWKGRCIHVSRACSCLCLFTGACFTMPGSAVCHG